MTRRLPILLLVLVLATAGCLAGDDGGNSGNVGTAANEDLDDDTTNTTNETPDPTPAYTWNTTTRDGSVSGANAVIVSSGATVEHFNVTRGSLNLTLNFTSSDGELWITIYPPGCESSDCSHRADTGVTAMGDGASTWSTDDPDDGHWQVELYRGNAGSGSVSYTMETAILQPTAPS